MTKITIDRSTVELALGALEWHTQGKAYIPLSSQCAIAALRAALAEPEQEPEGSVCARCGGLVFDPVIAPPQRKPIDVDALGIPHGQQLQPAQQQEPVVSWGVDWGSNGDLSCAVISRRTSDGNREILAVEYGPTIAPPQRKPLSGEELPAFRDGDHAFLAGVRFAKAAHGIKENT